MLQHIHKLKESKVHADAINTTGVTRPTKDQSRAGKGRRKSRSQDYRDAPHLKWRENHTMDERNKKSILT